MKNKNGFTLIELLALIVVLAIVALIIVPVVLNVIERVRKESYKDSVYGIMESGKIYLASHMDSIEKQKKYHLNVMKINVVEIKENYHLNEVFQKVEVFI